MVVNILNFSVSVLFTASLKRASSKASRLSYTGNPSLSILPAAAPSILSFCTTANN